MTRAVLAAVFVAVAAVYAQQPTFQSGTEVVRIDTLVERNGTPILGLTAEDFEVRDNGTPQRIITLKQMDAVAVGVALDTSGSMRGDRFDRASRATLALLEQLHPNEPSVVVGFASRVSRLIPAGTPAAKRQELLAGAVSDEATGLGDGAYAAVLACDTGPGSKLLVLLSDGANNASWLSARDVIDAARRHEVVIYTVGVGARARTPRPILDPRFQSAEADRGYNAAAEADARGRSDALKLLDAIAQQTGGRTILAGWNDDLSKTFRDILQEYRQRYIIAFYPEGVGKGDGWHALEVKLKGTRKGQVHARAGYWSR